MQSKRKFSFLNIILLIAVIIFFIGILELSARIFYPCWDSIFPHRYISYDRKTNTFLGRPEFKGRMQSIDYEYDVPFSLDENGFRNTSKGSLQKASLFFLGDSFGFGWGVKQDEIFSSVVAGLLHIKESNLSVPGTDLFDYFIIGKNFIKNADGKVVVVCVTFENDILQYPDPEAAVKRTIPKRNAIVLLSFQHSAFVNVVAKLIHRNRFIVELIRKGGGFWGNSPVTSELNINAMQSSLNILAAIKRDLKPERFIIVFVPPRPQFNLKSEYINFVKKVSNYGYEVIDPTVEDDWEKTFFRMDGHWTKEAHQKVGHLLANKLGTLLH